MYPKTDNPHTSLPTSLSVFLPALPFRKEYPQQRVPLLTRLRNIQHRTDILRFLQDIRQLNRTAGIQDQDQRNPNLSRYNRSSLSLPLR